MQEIPRRVALLLALCVIIAAPSNALTLDEVRQNSSNRCSYVTHNVNVEPLAPHIVGQKGKYEAVFFWSLIRHATRTVTRDELPLINALVELKNRISSTSSENDLAKAIESAELNEYFTKETRIVARGTDEIKGIKMRWEQRLPKIFDGVILKHTKSDLTKHCAVTFGGQATQFDDGDPIGMSAKEDPLKGPAKELANNFEKQPKFCEIQNSVSAKLELEVSPAEVQGLYLACCLEVAYGAETLPVWCSVFSASDMELLSNHKDIEWYFSDGAGRQGEFPLAKAFFSQLHDYFEKAKKGAGAKQSAFVNFSHAEAIVQTLTKLKLPIFKSPAESIQDAIKHFLTLDAERGAEKMKDVITKPFNPFSANLSFVLFHNPEEDVAKQYVVGCYLHEELYRLPGCEDYIPYSQFEAIVRSAIV